MIAEQVKFTADMTINNSVHVEISDLGWLDVGNQMHSKRTQTQK